MNAEKTLLGWIVLVTIAAAAVLALDVALHRAQRQPAHEFQQMLLGLGLGPALDLSHCPFSFDPRVGHGCEQDVGAIAGGLYFCSQHAGSIFFCAPPLVQPRGSGSEANQDAEVF
jgi:hypothetical protein